MEKKGYKDSYIHISKANKRALTEIERRKAGGFSGLKTRWPKLNSRIGGGIQYGYNYLIAALSGSGKTTIANLIETDLFDLNPEEDFIILNFNFETQAYMNIIKKYSADLKTNTDDILSVQDAIDESLHEEIKTRSKRLDGYPIYYFERAGNTDQIKESILDFQAKHINSRLICMLDHTALVNFKNEKSELELITNLAKMSMEVKKLTDCTFIFLGQLNSNIEQIERIKTPTLHYPMRSDLFGAKAIYNAMDAVYIPHRPEILNIKQYGASKLPTKDKLFWHVIKQRYGRVGFIEMEVDMSINSIEESE